MDRGRITDLTHDSGEDALPRRGVLLVNTKSRHGAEWFQLVREHLVTEGFELEHARSFRNPRDLPRAVAQAIRDGCPFVIVGGGDGTFSAVAHLFARKDAVMGVMPMGTGNAFARDLGIPATIQGACDVIVNGKLARVDMGLVGVREFVNLVTVGLSVRIARGLDDQSKRRLGKAVYVGSLIRALASVEPFQVRLELPGGTHEFESLQVVIGNGRFHAGPFQIAPDASITSGWLSIYALASPRKSAFFKLALHMMVGGQLNMDEVKVFRAQSGCLKTVGPKRVTVDGETCMGTPVEFGIAHGVLRVAVPNEFRNTQP